jgi:hypothetical protein
LAVQKNRNNGIVKGIFFYRIIDYIVGNGKRSAPNGELFETTLRIHQKQPAMKQVVIMSRRRMGCMPLLPVDSGASSLSMRSCELKISGSGIFNKTPHSMSGPRHPRIYPSLVEKNDHHNLIHREKLVKCVYFKSNTSRLNYLLYTG